MSVLLQAQGVGWKLEIVGALPQLPPFLAYAPQSRIVVEGVVVETWDATAKAMVRRASGDLVAPLFFEAVSYDIHFEKSDPKAELSLPAGAEPRRVRADGEHYYLNFGNNVGFFEISVISGGGRSRLTLEVFSRKVDYRTDYIRMRDEVSGILRNLAMAANAKTFGLAAPAKEHYPTLVEWFALIDRHFGEFIKLAGGIARSPHSRLVTEQENRDAERARRVSRRTLNRALRRNSIGTALPNIVFALPRRIREHISAITFDTPENRYFKGLLEATRQNVRALQRVADSGDEDADRQSERKFFDSIRSTLKSMERQLEAVLRAPFLGNVESAPLIRPESMVLHKDPLYSRFDKLSRILNGGLTFTGGVVPIGVKDTALLYEYWCFLKMVSLLRARFDLVSQSVVKFNRMRTTVALSKGRSSVIEFTHKSTGRPLYLVYNRLFNRLPTIAQKPGNVIQFASETRFYIFDAKYRIQFDRDYVGLYGGPGPMAEDVNTMHRYRDAIAIPHPMRPEEYIRGVVSGAVVLFPYPCEEAYREHKFFKSIRKVEIGGLPFLPETTDLVAEKIAALLGAEYPESSSAGEAECLE